MFWIRSQIHLLALAYFPQKQFKLWEIKAYLVVDERHPYLEGLVYTHQH